jgi:hypothetical protein
LFDVCPPFFEDDQELASRSPKLLGIADLNGSVEWNQPSSPCPVDLLEQRFVRSLRLGIPVGADKSVDNLTTRDRHKLPVLFERRKHSIDDNLTEKRGQTLQSARFGWSYAFSL